MDKKKWLNNRFYSIVILAQLLFLKDGSANGNCSFVQLGDVVMFNKYLSGFVLKTETGLLFDQCLGKCLKKPLCLSVNYHTVSRYCDINMENSTIYPNDIIDASGYIYISRKDIPKEFGGACVNTLCHLGKTCVGTASFVIGCHTTECHPVPLSLNNTIPSDRRFHSLGDSVFYRCIETGHPIPRSNVTCTKSGSWTDVDIKDFYICDIDCGSPPSISFGAVSYGRSKLDDNATYDCDTGYMMVAVVGGTVITNAVHNWVTCQINEQWSDSGLRCLRNAMHDNCYQQHDFMWYSGTKSITENGLTCQRWSVDYPNDIGISITSLYIENYCRGSDGFAHPWCYNSHSKEPRWEYCAVPKCSVCSGAPTPPINAKVVPNAGEMNVYGLLEYTCTDNFVPTRPTLVICQPNGQWTTIDFSCV